MPTPGVTNDEQTTERIGVMSKQIIIDHSDDSQLIVRPSLWGRASAALHLAALTLPLTFAGLALFFAVDYIFVLSEQEPAPGLFWLSLLALAALAAMLAAVVRFRRHESWCFDATNRQVTADVRGLFGTLGQGEAELREIEAIYVDRRRWPALSMLGLRLDGDREEIILKGRSLGPAVDEAAQAIEQFLKQHRYPIDVERPQD